MFYRNRDNEHASIECGVSRAEMLFRCNYLAVVKESEPKNVHLWDDVKGRFVARMELNEDVVAVRLRR